MIQIHTTAGKTLATRQPFKTFVEPLKDDRRFSSAAAAWSSIWSTRRILKTLPSGWRMAAAFMSVRSF